jgi:hypothetical protein
MANQEIYDQWTKFINDNKYKKYFRSDDDEWNDKFDQLKKYIDDNDKRPPSHDKDVNIKALGMWMAHQQNNYNKKMHSMTKPDLYEKWHDFITDVPYGKYFKVK